MPGFYARRTCLNGHVISNVVGAPFDSPQPFCSKWGEKTIVECPSCNTPQRGGAADVPAPGNKVPASYCFNCGQPYPWTKRRLAAAIELVKEEDQLSREDKEILTSSLPDLLSDTPSTPLAATRVKGIVGTATEAFKVAMYKFVVDVSSETAKKIILGQ